MPSRVISIFEHHDCHWHAKAPTFAMLGKGLRTRIAEPHNANAAVGAGGAYDEWRNHSIVNAMPKDVRQIVRQIAHSCGLVHVHHVCHCVP
jgi:hypothetical protein